MVKVNYRPPSWLGTAIPTSPHIYNADPSYPLMNTHYDISKVLTAVINVKYIYSAGLTLTTVNTGNSYPQTMPMENRQVYSSFLDPVTIPRCSAFPIGQSAIVPWTWKPLQMWLSVTVLHG